MNLEDRRDLRNRLLTARGHMAAIEEMIYHNAPCADIMHQMFAVRGAMRAIHRELWHAYLVDVDCGLRQRNENKRVRALQEFRALMRM